MKHKLAKFRLKRIIGNEPLFCKYEITAEFKLRNVLDLQKKHEITKNLQVFF